MGIEGVVIGVPYALYFLDDMELTTGSGPL
jgi:hypothetical protein